MFQIGLVRAVAMGMLDTPIAAALSRYLDLSVRQMQMTASNMANVDTPGYKTQGFDFAEAMQQSLQGRTAETETTVDGLVSRPDGNNVSMEREGMQLAAAQLQFKTGVELLRQEMNRLSQAIRSEGK